MEKISKKEQVVAVLKGATMMVAGLACATLVGAVVKNTVPMSNLSKYNKAMIVIGSGIFGGLAGEAGGKYAAGIVDSFEQMYDGISLIFKAKNIKLEEDEEEVPA